MAKRYNKRSYSRAFGSRSRSRSKSQRLYKPITKKVKTGKNLIRTLGSMAGEIAGSALPFIGPKRGRRIAGAIMNSMGVQGSGDYFVPFNIRHNSLMKLNEGTTPPKFSNNEKVTCVRHREYIGDVFSSNAFNTTGYPINPGMSQTFPWLSTVAANYECYRIKGMLFEFKSMSSNALTSTNTALGTVIMATQYNAAADAFTTKQQMENYEFAQSCKPAESVLHYIECSRGSAPLNELYVRTGNISANQTIQMYDVGEFYIATQGMQADNVNIGELWVTYDIELIKPKLLAISGQTDLLVWGGAGDGTTATTMLPSNLLVEGSPTVNVVRNGNSLVFQTQHLAGKNFQIEFYTAKAQAGDYSLVSLQNTNCVNVNWFPDGINLGSQRTAIYSNTIALGATTGRCIYRHMIKITGDNASVTYLGSALPVVPSGAGTVWIRILEVAQSQVSGIY